jgi:hypothetical protein
MTKLAGMTKPDLHDCELAVKSYKPRRILDDMKCYRPQATWRGFYWLWRLPLMIGACALWLAACSLSSAPGYKGDAPFEAFRPPTTAPTLTPTATITPVIPTETPVPTLAPVCLDHLTYVEDVTIPDGTTVQPGAVLDKRWKVRNSGTCNWDGRYRLKLFDGPQLEAPLEGALYPARGGAEALLRLEFVAPSDAGSYRSAWQAVGPQGQPFGDPFYIEIKVSP